MLVPRGSIDEEFGTRVFAGASYGNFSIAHPLELEEDGS